VWTKVCPLYDPCCGSGTIVIEAAQIACRIAAGLQRRFGFEKLRMYDAHVWRQLQERGPRPAVPSRAPPCLAAIWRFAWSTLRSATPSAQVWPRL
jgi:23S rRNA G2445 N2-methylase RlmL